jgi:hypothetical protein
MRRETIGPWFQHMKHALAFLFKLIKNNHEAQKDETAKHVNQRNLQPVAGSTCVSIENKHVC